jgi:hypothetical protein
VRHEGGLPTISVAFQLDKTQAELDFADVALHTDNPLFLDPFAISLQRDSWSQDAAATIRTFFQQAVDHIRAHREDDALELLLHLREPNETRLGYSRHRPQGAGVGSAQAEQIFDALNASAAVRTGFITALEEAELLIPGIARDKISDLTTNIIRHHLAEYTVAQCQLHGIATQHVAMPACFDADALRWEARYLDLPIHGHRPILFVPKSVVRYSPAYHQQKYYERYMLEFLREEELAKPRSNLVRVLKSGRRRVYKKDLKELYPSGKQYLFDFSRKHPEVLQRYRRELAELERSGASRDLNEGDESIIAGSLAAVLPNIDPGDEGATQYHRLMIGIVEFIFYPSLEHPRKEREIHQGRKRIDIVMENAAQTGVFYNIPTLRRIPCAYIPFECKNYGREVGNPELDQISGRFGVNRGQVGFLACRSFENRDRFIQRCRDTFQDGRGIVLPLDDATVLRYLGLIEAGNRQQLEQEWSNLLAEVTLN